MRVWFGGRGPAKPQVLFLSFATTPERESHHRLGAELCRIWFLMACVIYVFSLVDVVFGKTFPSS